MTFTEIITSPYFLALLFFVVAYVYSSVGLGGGSSYTALMAIAGLSKDTIPIVSQVLNLFVTSIGSFNFIRQKHANIKLITPFLVTSIPMAYVGGALKLPATVFYWLLLLSLSFVAVRIYFWRDTGFRLNLDQSGRIIISLIAGALLGLIAGIVGIGGGIYLVPLIIVLGLGTAKEAAACGAIFVWFNSVSGLISRLQHQSVDLLPYIPMVIAVIIGGAIGSYMGSTRFSSKAMEKILGVVIVVAIVFLIKKLIS